MQSELFELSSPKVQESAASLRPTFIERTSFTLTLEQAIGLTIVLLVFYVLTFSWGVERGKHLTFETHTVRPAAVPVETVAVFEEPAPVAKVVETVTKKTPVIVSELPKPVASVSKPVGKYTIQYVTYVTQSAADREAQRITKRGHSAFVIPTGNHFQVCIQAFQTRQEASRFLKSLKAQRTVSMDAYVRAIPA